MRISRAEYASDTRGACHAVPVQDQGFRSGRPLVGIVPPTAHARRDRLDWRRRNQACSRWYYQRTRLARRAELALVS